MTHEGHEAVAPLRRPINVLGGVVGITNLVGGPVIQGINNYLERGVAEKRAFSHENDADAVGLRNRVTSLIACIASAPPYSGGRRAGGGNKKGKRCIAVGVVASCAVIGRALWG